VSRHICGGFAVLVASAVLVLPAAGAGTGQVISLSATWKADSASSGTVTVTWSGVPVGSFNDGFIIMNGTGALDSDYAGVLASPCPHNSCAYPTGVSVDWMMDVHGGPTGSYSFEAPVSATGHWYIQIYLYGSAGGGSCPSCTSNVAEIDATAASSSGGGGGGGGGGSKTDCLATAGCVVPFLRPPELVRGKATIVHSSGASVPLTRAKGVEGGDTIVTGPKSAARIRFDNDSELTLGPSTTVGVPRASAVQTVVAGPLPFLLSIFGEVAWRISGGHAPLLLGGFNPYAVTWPDFEGYPGTTPVVPEPGLLPFASRALQSSTGVMLTVSSTRTSLRVSVYSGAAELRNRQGATAKTTFVRAGFQSVVNGAHLPSTPTRFTPPKNPFWK